MKIQDKLFKRLEGVNKKDNVDISKNFGFGKSKIHGEGVFASNDISQKDLIGTAIKGNDYKRTRLGKKVNHQFNSNSVLKDERDFNLYASKNIRKGNEITTNYKNTPSFIDKNTDGFKEM